LDRAMSVHRTAGELRNSLIALIIPHWHGSCTCLST
jgi:hypothetical protein